MKNLSFLGLILPVNDSEKAIGWLFGIDIDFVQVPLKSKYFFDVFLLPVGRLCVVGIILKTCGTHKQFCKFL